MKLLMDIGNSRLKWVVENNGSLGAVESLDYRRSEFLNGLTQRWRSISVPEKIAITSVSGKSVLCGVTELCKTLWPNVSVLIPRSTDHAFGVTSAYDSPEKLGIDRWLALIASHKQYTGNVCVVDCGTAITIDALQANGKHLGGVICPGLVMMKKALASDTADLPFNTQPYSLRMASNTSAAIANGVLFAAVGLINNVVQRLEGDYQLVLTGGDAEIIAESLATPFILDKKLVLKGLSICCSGEQAA